jgi:dihydropteroate synthase
MLGDAVVELEFPKNWRMHDRIIPKQSKRALCNWQLHEQKFLWRQQTYLMGILNVTPDSFSDGGQFNTVAAALAQAHYLVQSGAHILDVGGQSTRPQALEISLEEELERVIPVVEAVRRELTVPISVDTTRSQVARAAIAAGADLINDISGATYDLEMLATVAELDVPIILMHIRGTPETMQTLTNYQDLIGEIIQFLQERIAAAIAAGVKHDQIAIDPGIGFAKTADQNLEILRRLPELAVLNCPILIGTSRKSFIGQILQQPNAQKRIWGTAASCCAAIAGGAHILRVHDVEEMAQACCVADAVWRSRISHR